MSRSARPLLAIAALLTVLSTSMLAACGSDSGQTEGSIEVTDAVVPFPPNPRQAAVYFTIENGSGTDDALVEASSTVAGTAVIHRSMTEGGMASMDEQATVDVPAGETVTFEPGGLHVMLTELEGPLDVGDTFDVQLTFAEAGQQTVPVEVVAGIDAADDMGDMDHQTSAEDPSHGS